MENSLSFISDSMDVGIKNYTERKFKYDKWIVSDKYVLNENKLHLSKYSLVITSPVVRTKEELDDYRINGEKVVNRITHFIPICGLPSLNSPKYVSFYSDVSIIDYANSPNGWKTDYNELREKFNTQKTRFTITASFGGVRHYSIIENTPLEDLKIIMDNYDSIGEETKYLIFLYNAILSSSDDNVYMIIGKALEIINAIYPLNGKKDNRLRDFFPELEDVYKEHSIKELIGLSNTRKETRHYIKDKTRVIPHESLSKEEGSLLYKLSTNLILNAIRDRFELSRYAIIYE